MAKTPCLFLLIVNKRCSETKPTFIRTNKMNKMTKKPLSIALGAAFVTSLATAPIVSADANPFGMSELSSGYMVVADNHEGKAEGKCGEGKCGENKAKKEGKCGEGKCGEGMKKAKDAEGKCGEKDAKGEKEGSCGEGKAKKEGSCGEGKAKEGNCAGKKE
jgi:uncharacterized low-complexity protein